MFRFIKKLFLMLLGKANKIVEDNTDAVEKLMLLRDDFENQVQMVNENLIQLSGQEKLIVHNISELHTEIKDIDDKLQKIKEHVATGAELSENDRARAEKQLAKKEALLLNVDSQQAMLNTIRNTVKELKGKMIDLDNEKIRVNALIANAETNNKTAKSLESYSKALEIINNDKTSNSMKAQVNKIQEKLSISQARAEIANSNSSTMDFEKTTSRLDDFLKG